MGLLPGLVGETEGLSSKFWDSYKKVHQGLYYMRQGSGLDEIANMYFSTYHHYKNSATGWQGVQETGSKSATANGSVHVGVLI